MQTYSHFLVTAFVGDRLRRRMPIQLTAFLVGSVLPDVPLIVLTLGYFASRAVMGYGPEYDQLFFHNPVWIVSYNVLHAPLDIALLAGVGCLAWQRERAWGAWLTWFALGCGLHTTMDVFTHAADGPLLLFPFDWHLRFHSPISYWNAAYHGGLEALLEHLVDLAIVVYFALAWLARRRSVRPPGGPLAGDV